MSATDRQVAGDHYKKIKPEPWEVMYGWDKDHFIGFLRYCAVKRLARWDSKDGALQDVRKAIHELQRLEEILAEDEEEKVDPAKKPKLDFSPPGEKHFMNCTFTDCEVVT